MSTPPLHARREAAFGHGAPLFYDEPVEVVKGEGVWLIDTHGRRLLDLYNNVPCVGHANPRVAEAMYRQALTLNVHSRYLHEGVVAYAERLAALHAQHIDSVVFTCSGTEATEVALLMARAAAGDPRAGIIATDAAYHGNSTEVRKLSRIRTRQGSGDPSVRAVAFPDLYRPLQPAASEAELCDLYIAELQRSIDSFAADGIPFAAFIVCSILANEGLPRMPAGYLQRAAALVRSAGGLVIADEVQAGFCRTGQWWGYQASGFTPDIVTMGKPMGNGLPLAGTAASAALVERFRSQTGYFNTYAGSPLQAAVGNTVLDVLEDEQLAASVAVVGQYLRDGLCEVTAACPQAGEVRGHGLFLGIDWVDDCDSKRPDEAGARQLVNRLRQRGFLVSNAGYHRNVIKIRPPLVFQREHADSFVNALAEVLGTDVARGA